jgi:hypothetical protein
VIEVEVLECLAGREAGGPDAEFSAVGLTGRDFSLQTGGEEVLVGPALVAGPFGEAVDRPGQRRRLERPAEIDEIGGWLGLGGGGHQAAPVISS